METIKGIFFKSMIPKKKWEGKYLNEKLQVENTFLIYYMALIIIFVIFAIMLTYDYSAKIEVIKAGINCSIS